ncbi:hypothetical protein H4S00_002365, partial [Coemansia sp. D1744]
MYRFTKDKEDSVKKWINGEDQPERRPTFRPTRRFDAQPNTQPNYLNDDDFY